MSTLTNPTPDALTFTVAGASYTIRAGETLTDITDVVAEAFDRHPVLHLDAETQAAFDAARVSEPATVATDEEAAAADPVAPPASETVPDTTTPAAPAATQEAAQ